METVGFQVRRGSAVETVCRDDPPRADVTLERLARLAPASLQRGTVTAGSSSGINDGAAAVAAASRAQVAELGLSPLARVVSTAVAGMGPSCMASAPCPPRGRLHPLGAGGARILTALVNALHRNGGGRYELATMCIGVGHRIAMVVERT